MKTLTTYNTNEDTFDLILKTMSTYIKVVPNISEYYKGYPNKKQIYYNGNDTMILKECLFVYFANLPYDNITDWKQCIIKKIPMQIDSQIKTIDGSRAYSVMISKLKKFYSDSEIDACLKSHTSKYNPEKIQYHYFYDKYPFLILKHENCTKYDINGAHHDALIEIFPKAKDILMKMYLERKTKPIYKQYINYFVGMLCRKGYRETYNWIVQRTTAKLSSAIDFVGGDLIYANTDGFMVSNAKNKLQTSTNLGDFKLEYEGTSYTYMDKNYWCYQINKNGKKDITGNVLYSVRDKIDLENNIFVRYDRKVDSSLNIVTADNVEVLIYE